MPYHWLLTSRNKESLALDLSKDAGQALMHQLIAKADVMTTNFMRGQLERYQLTYPTLKAINPRLVFGHITGYGDEGPEADRRAFDVTGWWARSGMMEFVRDPEQTPLMPAPGMGDHSTATALFGAIMSGLYKRERTGEGCHVSTSLAANGVWQTAWPCRVWLLAMIWRNTVRKPDGSIPSVLPMAVRTVGFWC